MKKEAPTCPFCKEKQTKKPTKKWSFGAYKVERYLCQCEKKFNSYKSNKSSWTIPKLK